MSAEHLKTGSHKLKLKVKTHEAWWYEENFGISVVVSDPKTKKSYIVPIRWTSIRAALKRKDREGGGE